jgi:DNA-binding NtrC family response regulator/tetratricopeptide (TPR) repeat protein
MGIDAAAEGFAGVINLFNQGRFRQAYGELRPLGSPRRIGERTLYELLRAELLLELGDLSASLNATATLSKEVDPTVVCRRERTRCRAYFYRGDYAASMRALQFARQAAIESGSSLLRAQIGLTDLTLSSAAQSLEATSSALTDLKRLVAHAGEPHLMVELRLCVARAEARSNSLREAEKHVATAEALLERYPNLWLSGALELDRAIIKTLNGDIESALHHLQIASDYADQSGHFRTKAAALINSAQLLSDHGEAKKAQALFETAIKQAQHHPQLLVAALDGQANFFLNRGEHDRAIQAFAQVGRLSSELGQARLHWDKLTERYSRARLYFSQGNLEDAIKELALAREAALRSNDRIWLNRIELLQVKCLALRGDRSSALAAMSRDADTAFSAEMVARWHGAVAAIYPVGTPESKAHLARAVRVAKGLSNITLAHDLEHGFPRSQDSAYAAPPRPDLESAVALLEVAGHPHILAREALALIEGSGCVDEVALIARGTTGVRVIEARGWDERRALQAARRPESIETIPCGMHRDEALELIAPPEDDIERQCTWIAIKKLVATALTLDRYRRDEKQRAALWPTESLEGDPDILWVSEPVNEVVRVAKRIGPTPLTVLLTGETGVGKEMLARTIHLSSNRADKVMLAFNCTAVPRDMLESQLFGYRRGAFTGADTSYVGVIRAAEGGTLFLDEIADMPLDLQPKLLRFLETHEIHPLGEPHPIKVDVRVIAATNANLEKLVAEGRFRQDLFYRLNVVHLRLPPLRERREEIPALVEHYIRRYADQQKKGRLTLTDEALEYLLLYNWPGNLRQLANEVHRMVAMAEPDSALTAAHLSAEIQATRRTIAAPPPESELRISLDQPLPAAVELLERTMVQNALERAKGRLEEAAKILGISRKGLFLKRRRWGLRQ